METKETKLRIFYYRGKRNKKNKRNKINKLSKKKKGTKKMTKKEYKEALELGLKLCTDTFHFRSQDAKGNVIKGHFKVKDHDHKKIIEKAKAICKLEKTKLICVIGYIDFGHASSSFILFPEYEERHELVSWMEEYLKKNHII